MDIFDRLMDTMEDIYKAKDHDLITENANTDGKSPVGQLSISAEETSKLYAEKLLDADVLKAFKEGFIHVHDFGWYATGSTTCCQIPLGKLLKSGFRIGECVIRPPKTISTAVTLASIVFQSNQNMQHGGQAYSNFDFDLAPYVKNSFEKHKKEIAEALNLVKNNLIITKSDIDILAWENTKKDTFQAMEGFVHNMNSLLCRSGYQVPFTSVNFGLDTSKEGRLISEMLMKAQIQGLGDGSTPIFPILIFKYKDGVNAKEGDPNYDLYKLALECTAKRLFPNFVNCDATYNKNESGDPRKEIATMGCRTRLYSDVNGEANPEGRGNLSFTTINLPMVAQSSTSVHDFMFKLDYYVDLCLRQLRKRYEYQKSISMGNFKFLYGNGVWKGSDEIKNLNRPVGDVLNTGTMAVGFIGLAETLKILIGEHHGESERAWQLGYSIIEYMKMKTDKATELENLNYSIICTPAEGYAGKSVRQFKAKYGVIEGVSDKEFFTNSCHIPVYYDIKAIDKIKLEAPFHELTLGGHICYVELDGDVAKNLDAMDKVVKAMMNNNVGYGAINHPVDHCRECGHDGIIDEDICPYCGSDDISRIRRITGYLVGSMERFNSGKRAEVEERVKHGQ